MGARKPPQTHKVCNRCGIDKSAAEFSTKEGGRLRCRCKACNAAVLLEPTVGMFAGWLKRNYGLTLKHIEDLSASINTRK